MADEMTVKYNGKSYILSRSGWVEAISRLRVNISLSRRLDKLAITEFGNPALPNIDALLEQVSNARADSQLLRAEELVRQVIRYEPGHLGANTLLCSVLRERGMPQLALDETAHIRSSKYPPLITSRAAAYCDLQQWEQAAQELKPVLAAGGSKEAFSVVQRIKSNQPDVYGTKKRAPLSRAIVFESIPIEQEERKLSDQEELRPLLKHVIIHTDGACIGNPGPGGYGVILTFGTHQKEFSGGFRQTTNNRIEIISAIVALEQLKYRCKVTLYSDSQYLVHSMSRGWVLSWRAKGWMRNKRERASNADLWERLLGLTSQHDVEFIWIKGHANNPENIRCDFLAMQAAERENLSPDIEYENIRRSSPVPLTLFSEITNSNTAEAKPKMRRGWKEIAQAELALADVLRGSCGRETGEFIYIVRYCRIPVYIGLTRDTIKNRLWHHIKEHSNVGVAIMADKGKDFVGWSVLVIRIKGELEAAERYYIRRVRPPMNIEDNGNSQDNVTETVRVFKRNYRPDPFLKYRRRKRRGERG